MQERMGVFDHGVSGRHIAGPGTGVGTGTRRAKGTNVAAGRATPMARSTLAPTIAGC